MNDDDVSHAADMCTPPRLMSLWVITF